MTENDNRDRLLRKYLIEEKKMPLEQVEHFLTEYSQLSEKDKSELIFEAVGKRVYKEMPPTIEEFMEDPYYLGDVMTLFPIWKKVLKEIYPAPFCKKYDRVILSTATRCFGKGTPILMYDGTVKNVEDIEVGDLLIGPDSKPRTVLSLARGREEMYKIVPRRGGNSFVCNASHKLALKYVRYRKSHKNYGKYLDIEVKDFLNLPESEKKHLRIYHSGPIEYSKKELLIDPYITGVWLGNKGKKLPIKYLTSTIEDRRLLLASIINNNKNKNIRYKDLAEDYATLARSLGFRATVKERNKKLSYKNEIYTSYDVNITGDFNTLPLRVERRKSNGKTPVRDYSISEFTIEPLGEDNYYGFEVDKDHKFLLSDYLVQNNSGKTFCTIFSLLYEIYLLTCMIDPCKLFMSSNIVFAVLSKDTGTAISQGCSYLYRGLTQSPCFKGRIREKLSFSKLDKDGVSLTDDILLKAGATLGTVVGSNLFAGCLDEANMPSASVALESLVEYRLKIYNEMIDRKTATFSKAPKMSGILWFTSSPTEEGDVLGEIIQDVERNAIPNVLIRDNIARWEAREEDVEETFPFFLGSDTKDPCIVEDGIELKPEEWERVIEVPNTMEYYNAFKTNSYDAIQNIAGRRTMPESALFNSVDVFEKVFCKENNIFKRNILNIPVNSGLNVDDYLYDPTYFSHPNKPECYRYIHLDIAYSGDKFGISSVYSDRVKYISAEDGTEIMRRKYYIDFCLGIVSPNKEKVDVLKVIEFIYGLKEKGYPIKIVTTDNQQGELARQVIKKKGVKTDYLSVEKSKDQYLNLKNIILTESLEGYRNPELTKELRGLRENQKKIQKGKGYTDDMSDSLAGALWTCSQDRFYKKTNDAITELIQQTGNMNNFLNNGSMGYDSIRKGFSGLSSHINKINHFNRNQFNF